MPNCIYRWLGLQERSFHRRCCLWGKEADLVSLVVRLLGFAVKAQSSRAQLPVKKNRSARASGCWILLVFSFLFIHFVGIYPVEGVNCPPVRAKPKIIRRNAIPRRDFSFIWLSPGSSCLRSREAPVPASIILQTTTSVWPKMRWNVAGRDQDLAYQIALQPVKRKISRNLNAKD